MHGRVRTRRASVELVGRYSNFHGGRAPSLEGLQRLLDLPGNGGEVAPVKRTPPRLLARRLNSEVTSQIAAKYEAGATSHELRAEFNLAQGSILKILDEAKVTRKRGLSEVQIKNAIALYESGRGIQGIAEEIGASYTGTRGALLRSGVELRGRLDYQRKA